MSEAGFFQQKRASPTGFALVVLMHAAVLGAVIMIKGPTFIRHNTGPIDLINITPDRVPPEVQPPPPDRPEPLRPEITYVPRNIPIPSTNTDIVIPRTPVIDSNPVREPIYTPPADPPTPARDPVRRDASVDQRYADALQPPYPLSEQRAERTGQVRLEVTIGTDGRVKAVRRLSATNEAFWEVAERQARTRWRFRPATLDGRPVESTKVMTLYFRLENV
jgi:periplasmic protein TonB